jgi:two-component sensor histidine kinase
LKAKVMTSGAAQISESAIPSIGLGRVPALTAEGYERELAQLRSALGRSAASTIKKDALIQQMVALSSEADHRLLNSVQMIGSLLAMQSRASSNDDVASQLAAAALRVMTIGRIHRRLHSHDAAGTVEFKPFLDDLCIEFSAMLFSQAQPERVIFAEGIDLTLPTTIGIPLAFIANELIMNAAKHGQGGIKVSLNIGADQRYALSVANDGPALSLDFDPAASKGLGMKIVRSLAGSIGGDLKIACAENGKGACFTVIFGRSNTSA